EDFTVGGKEFEDFYDKIVPNAANDIGKKYGVKTEQGNLEDGKQIHVLPITPEMRESVLTQGQPLFMPNEEDENQGDAFNPRLSGEAPINNFQNNREPLRYANEETSYAGREEQLQNAARGSDELDGLEEAR